ncbi:MAG: hypothetical protein AAFV53_18760 [Myxococcota bacterium]
MRIALLFLVLGCQEPFDTDRHDLRGFRIAAIGVDDGLARAAVWSGDGPWHEASPTLVWSLDGAPLGEGFDVTVTAGGLLELDATAPDGQTRSATVTVQSAPFSALSVSRGALVIGEDLSLDGRRSLSADPVDVTAPSGSAMRLTLSGVGADQSARWMTAGGTILEVETDAADFFAEEIRFDDGEIEVRAPVDDGLYPGLALVVDGEGDNSWLWFDAAVGVDTTAPFAHHRGRLMPSDDSVGAGLIAATLEEDAISGVRLSDVQVVEDAQQQDELECIPDGAETFEIAWIAEGRCPRPDVLGARVVLEVE